MSCHRPIALVATVGLVGCFSLHTPGRDGGTDSDARPSITTDGGPGLIRAEDFGELYRQARCRHAARCEGHPFGWPEEIAGWCHPRSREVSYSWPEIPRFDGSCAPEWVDYSPELARRCIDAVDGADCHLDYGEADLICNDVFLLYRLPPSWACAPHRCPDGELCTITGSCTGSFDCPHACRPPLSEGETCVVSAAPWPDDCAEGLRCAGGVSSGSAGTCERQRGEGEPCGLSAPCHDDLFCWDGVCTISTGTRGGPCNWNCRGDDVCVLGEEGGRCVAGAPIGEACSEECFRDEVCDPLPCAPGSRCVDGTCVRTVHEGEACGADAVCIVSFHCEEGRCVADPVESEPCSDAIPCARGVCDGERCRMRAPGDACLFEDTAPLGECPSGLYGCDIATDSCDIALSEGELCIPAPLDCAPGLRCNYVSSTCEVDDSCRCRGLCAPPEP